MWYSPLFFFQHNKAGKSREAGTLRLQLAQLLPLLCMGPPRKRRGAGRVPLIAGTTLLPLLLLFHTHSSLGSKLLTSSSSNAQQECYPRRHLPAPAWIAPTITPGTPPILAGDSAGRLQREPFGRSRWKAGRVCPPVFRCDSFWRLSMVTRSMHAQSEFEKKGLFPFPFYPSCYSRVQ